MRTRKQEFLPGFNFKSSFAHGGELAKGKRKTVRPLDLKQALHVVLRSTRAQGVFSLLHPNNCDHVHGFTYRIARRLGVRIYRYANVGNHIHLLVRVSSRIMWKRFIRELAGGIAIIVTGAKKGAALTRPKSNALAEGAKRGFWDHLTFTRIVLFGKDFKNLCNYMVKNLFEAAGVPMKKYLAQGYQIMSIEKDGIFSGSLP